MLIMVYENQYYYYYIKHLLKIHNLWNYVLSIGCWEWDCYPQDAEDFLLQECLSSVGIRS